MTVQMIRPSTTKKIATAITNVMVYRSRILAPSVVTAFGGNKDVTNRSPSSRRFTPRASRIRTTPTMAADTAIAKTAVDEEARDLGEPDIKALERGRAPPGRDDRCEQARSTALGV